MADRTVISRYRKWNISLEKLPTRTTYYYYIRPMILSFINSLVAISIRNHFQQVHKTFLYILYRWKLRFFKNSHNDFM